MLFCLSLSHLPLPPLLLLRLFLGCKGHLFSACQFIEAHEYFTAFCVFASTMYMYVYLCVCVCSYILLTLWRHDLRIYYYSVIFPSLLSSRFALWFLLCRTARYSWPTSLGLLWLFSLFVGAIFAYFAKKGFTLNLLGNSFIVNRIISSILFAYLKKIPPRCLLYEFFMYFPFPADMRENWKFV